MWERLNGEYRQIAARNMLLAVELNRLLEVIAAENIRVIPFKGLATAAVAYKDMSLRQFGDLDLLVLPSDYERMRAVLRSLGMSEISDYGWESSYVDSTGHVCVDLHKSITGPGIPIHFDFETMHSRLVPTNCGNVQALSPEDLMLVLCVQVAKDGLARRLVLAKVADIGALLTNQPELSWSRVTRNARRLGCRRIVGTSIQLAGMLLDTVPDIASVRTLQDDRHVDRLAEDIAHSMFPGVWTRRREALSERRRYFLIRERWRDGLSPHVDRLARGLFQPNEKDRAFLRLPRSLHHIYYLVRPIRLVRDYAVAGWRTLTGPS